MGMKTPWRRCDCASSAASLLLVLLLLLLLLLLLEGRIAVSAEGELTRGSFPEGFVFGTASSAYQYEGAVKADGRGQTIWDKFAHTFGKIIDLSDADVAVDQYHRFEEDIQLMVDMGMDAYRFSIAWARILPNGVGAVNQAGIDHYNKLIDALLAKGIQPYVTLYHWDLPQNLQDEYMGWLDRRIVNDFAVYAETCFKEFGDRVKQWITVNEPYNVAVQGYGTGLKAPARCSGPLHLSCSGGNSGTEPYIVAHNLILAHANVSNMYRNKYKASQKGELGIALEVIWFEAMTNTWVDMDAAKRSQEFQLGWFADPFFLGDYPATMRKRVGERLPRFTAEEASLVKGALDFVGINHYTTHYTSHNDMGRVPVFKDVSTDSGAVSQGFAANGTAIGDRANSIWLFIVPRGMRSVVNYVKDRYNNPPVYITENGMDDSNNPLVPIKDALKDTKRIKYHNDYLTNLAASISDDGCDVRGYFAWSLMDNWEWAGGYTSRFGLYFIDYKDNLNRYPKDSVQWFKNLLSSTCDLSTCLGLDFSPRNRVSSTC